MTDPTIHADFLVDGMTCEHCVRSVTEEVSAIEGVSDVQVQLNVGGPSRVTVQSGTDVDPKSVRAAIEEAGYTLAGTA